MNEDIIITSTLHDPKGNLSNILLDCLSTLQVHVPNLIVVCTPSTHPKIIKILSQSSISLFVSHIISNRENYQKSLKLGKQHAQKITSEYIFYGDFDRILHWIKFYPEEFWEILHLSTKCEYTHIGRTSRAFLTHPKTQIETEKIANKLGAQLLNHIPFDLLSACWCVSPRLIDMILDYDNPTPLGFYASWPILLWTNAKTKQYLEVEGQEWETPDRFQEDIKILDYNVWIEQFMTKEEWTKRVELLNNCLEELFVLGHFQKK